MYSNAFRQYPHLGYLPFVNPYFYSESNIDYSYLNSVRPESYPYTTLTEMYPYSIPTETYSGIVSTEVNPYFISENYHSSTESYDDMRVISGILAIAGAAGQVAGAVNAVSSALGTINAPRSVVLQITNHTNSPLRKVREKLDHGGWAATPTAEIPPGQTLVFGAQSASWSVATGTEGSVTYAGDGVEMTVYWNNPFVGNNSCNISVTGPKSIQYVGTRVCGAGNTNAQMRYELKSIPFPVFGAIRDKWVQFQGNLGNPVDGEKPTFDGTGRAQHFQGGIVSWHPQTGAHVVWGLIGERWLAIGREKFGFPITDELATPDGRGRYNHFRAVHLPGKPEASIYWTPQTGAHEIYGAIRGKWAELGWEKSRLGYPVGPEQDRPGGGRIQRFQGGAISWTPQGGAVVGP
ncbi:LGFP repeat-containing protein [Bacillus sp. NA_146.1]